MSLLSNALNAFTKAVSANPSGIAAAATALGSAISSNAAAIAKAQSYLSMYTSAVTAKDTAGQNAAKVALVGLEDSLPASFNAAFSEMCDPAIQTDAAQFAIETHQALAALTAATSSSAIGSVLSAL